eukprot:123557_1
MIRQTKMKKLKNKFTSIFGACTFATDLKKEHRLTDTIRVDAMIEATLKTDKSTRSSASNTEVSSQSSFTRQLINGLSPNDATILEQILRIPLLKLFSTKEKISIAKALRLMKYKKDEIIIKSESECREFFMIVEGTCNVLIDDKVCNKLSKHDYCGEQAFLSHHSKCKHHTTVCVTSNELIVLCLNEESFKLLRQGPIFFIQRNKNHSLAPEYLYRDTLCDDEKESLFSFNGQRMDDALSRDRLQEWLEQPDDDHVVPVCLEQLLDECEDKKAIITHWIAQQLAQHLLFDLLFAEQIEFISKCFRRVTFSAMEYIVKNDNQSLFLVGRGSVTEWDDDQINQIHSRGMFFGDENIVFDLTKHKNNLDLQNTNINIVFQTFEPTILYELDRCTYKRIMSNLRKTNRRKIISFLRSIPLFSSLLNAEIERLSSVLKIHEYAAGDSICRQFEKSKFWYLIYRGKANQEATVSSPLLSLKQADYFGETELLYNTTNRRTIIAETDVCCLCVGADDFAHVLGPIEQILSRGMAADFDATSAIIEKKKKKKYNILKENKLSSFKLGPFIGRGKYAAVRLVRSKKRNTLYALKCIHKSFVFSKSGRLKKYCLKILFNERDALRECSAIYESSFITRLFGTFSDSSFVYFVLECGCGGDFGRFLERTGSVSENDARFYLGCLISAVYDLHCLDLVHRDIKPENLMLMSSGYLKLSDFGFCKRLRSGQATYTLCGTVGYIAPEIILGKGYNKCVDWFAVGCFLFHILTGSVPFPSYEEQFDILKKCHTNKCQMVPSIPRYLSAHVSDLLKQFLQYKPLRRLGYNPKIDIGKIKQHQWFTDFDWDLLHNQTMTPPTRFMAHKEGKEEFVTKWFKKSNVSQSMKQRFNTFNITPQLQNWDKDF